MYPSTHSTPLPRNITYELTVRAVTSVQYTRLRERTVSVWTQNHTVRRYTAPVSSCINDSIGTVCFVLTSDEILGVSILAGCRLMMTLYRQSLAPSTVLPRALVA